MAHAPRIDFDAEVESFKEVGAVGTGVVITVIESITRGSKVYKFEQPPGRCETHQPSPLTLW